MFSKNRDRLLTSEVAQRFFAEINRLARRFIATARALHVTAHVRKSESGRRSNLDRRTTRHAGYARSLSRRWLVEKTFGWLKQTGPLAQVKLRGLAKVDWVFVFSCAAHNLLRLIASQAQQGPQQQCASKPVGSSTRRAGYRYKYKRARAVYGRHQPLFAPRRSQAQRPEQPPRHTPDRFLRTQPPVGVDSLAGGLSGIGEHNTDVVVGYTHVFSPSLLFNVTNSYFHLPIFRTPQNAGVDCASIIPGLPAQLIEGAPQIFISNITGIYEAGSKDLEQDVQGNAVVIKILARHAIKTGFSYLFDDHYNISAVSPQRGAFSFNGRYTGVAYADFLLGDPSSTAVSTPADIVYRNLSNQFGLFIQDDYRLADKLTLDYGLRYDIQNFQNNQYDRNLKLRTQRRESSRVVSAVLRHSGPCLHSVYSACALGGAAEQPIRLSRAAAQ